MSQTHMYVLECDAGYAKLITLHRTVAGSVAKAREYLDRVKKLGPLKRANIESGLAAAEVEQSFMFSARQIEVQMFSAEIVPDPEECA